MVDKVYEDSMQRYNQARRIAEELVRTSLDYITARADTSGQGVPVAVFNTSGLAAHDVAEVDVAFSQPGVRVSRCAIPAGNAIPVQVLNELRNDDEGIRQARIAFIARDVPAMGYSDLPRRAECAWPAGSTRRVLPQQRWRIRPLSRTSSIAPRSISGPAR